MLNNPLIKIDHVILMGDLNFTLGACEIWGPVAKMDPLLEFFIKKLEATGIIDL
jgi:hypothetical protein